jgi:hypothetical protein
MICKYKNVNKVYQVKGNPTPNSSHRTLPEPQTKSLQKSCKFADTPTLNYIFSVSK